MMWSFVYEKLGRYWGVLIENNHRGHFEINSALPEDSLEEIRSLIDVLNDYEAENVKLKNQNHELGMLISQLKGGEINDRED